MPLPLPPGVNRRSFSAALREFESVVGSEWVFTQEDDVNIVPRLLLPVLVSDAELAALSAYLTRNAVGDRR